MATQVSSFSLSDGDGTFHTVMKLVMSNKGKREIVTTSRCFKKCGDDGCVPYNANSDGSTPCIAWVASCVSLRSKYGEHFFNPCFSKRAIASPFFFSCFGKFSPQKKRWSQFGGSHKYKTKQNKTNYLPS